MVEITIQCWKCRGKNAFTLSDGVGGRVSCAECRTDLFAFRGIAGYVYILSNPSMPGLVKIGCTTRSVDDRLKELNAPTSVPSPFTVEAYFETTEPKEVEGRVHERLDKYRVEGREFFRISVAAALGIVRSVLGEQSLGREIVDGPAWDVLKAKGVH